MEVTPELQEALTYLTGTVRAPADDSTVRPASEEEALVMAAVGFYHIVTLKGVQFDPVDRERLGPGDDLASWW